MVTDQERIQKELAVLDAMRQETAREVRKLQQELFDVGDKINEAAKKNLSVFDSRMHDHFRLCLTFRESCSVD